MDEELDYLLPGPRSEPSETVRLARVAGRLGALDDRLRRGPSGWRHRLALIEAAELSWFVGDRVSPVNRPGFTGGQNSRRFARYGTDIKEEDLEAVFTRCPAAHVYMRERVSSASARCVWRWNTAMDIRAKLRR